MDDELKLKIAASLDRATDAEADADVVRAMSDDPSVEAWARGVYSLDRALRQWPDRRRGEGSWDRLAERIRKRVEEKPAKGRKGASVTTHDADLTAIPVFEDDTAPPMEQQTAMPETNEHDADLEGLAALTRTSQVPGAMPSTPPRSLGPSLVDAPDDTSSGLVDMKTLAAATREAAASVPPPIAIPAAAPAESAKARDKVELSKLVEKTDDVIAKPKATPVAAPVVVAEPQRKGGNTWLGALGGMAVATAAFLLYTRSQAPTPSMESAVRAVDQNAPAAAPAAPSEGTPPAAETPAPQPAAPPVAAAAPEPAPAPTPVAAPVAAPAPQPVAAPPPPAAEREPERAARTRAAREESARPAAPRAEPAPAPAQAAPPAPPAAQRPAATAAAAPARPAAAPAGNTAGPGARPASVDDLINRVAGSGPAAPAAPAAAAPTAEVPERLTRPQITSVLTPLNGAVRACAQGQTGTAPVAIVIGSDGVVRSASVSGQFAGGEIGSCIEGVVRRAHFPQFRAPTANVTWPFVILPPR